MRCVFAALAVLFGAAVAWGAKTSPLDALLPKPKEAKAARGELVIRSAEVEMPDFGARWREWLDSCGVREAGGANLNGVKAIPIVGRIVEGLPGVPEGNTEAYRLKIGPDGINVEATGARGLYWALTTVEQLAEATPQKTRGAVTLPRVEILDWPAFEWRGLMQDVGRTYVSVPELKKQIRLMSRFKANVFHMHFTENQAWRLESRLFPMLNDSVNMTRCPGEYYTQQEARELTRYAADHGVMLVPEIDVPGHSEAFTRTFRHDMQSPQGEKIVRLLLDEAIEEVWPDDSVTPYIHLGTDEVSHTNERFVPDMVALVRSHGKKAITWMPGADYGPGEIDLLHLWSFRGKAHDGIPAIDSKLHYLNHLDTYADLRALYRSNPYHQGRQTPDVLGEEIAIWNDRYIGPDEGEGDADAEADAWASRERSNAAQNNLYAYLLAVAERSWMGDGREYFDNYGTLMAPEDTEDFREFCDFERRLLWHKEHALSGEPVPYVRQTDVVWAVTDPFPNGGDLDAVFPPETEPTARSYRWRDSTYNVRDFRGAGHYLRHVWGAIDSNHSVYDEPKPDHTAYAYTYVYSPRRQEVGMQLEFQNYSRSDSDLPPRQGAWDWKHSRVWLNGQELLPPQWSSQHTERSMEAPLGNVNFSAREPRLVTLDKGWNRVMLKLPVGAFSIPEVRLNKWMFTCVFTTPDGLHAAPGLVYSPERKR